MELFCPSDFLDVKEGDSIYLLTTDWALLMTDSLKLTEPPVLFLLMFAVFVNLANSEFLRSTDGLKALCLKFSNPKSYFFAFLVLDSTTNYKDRLWLSYS